MCSEHLLSGLPWQSFASSSIRSSVQTIKIVRGCRVLFNNELDNLENSPTADAVSSDRRYKSLASLVKSTPRDRWQFKCMPWMKEWWRYAKQRERGQPRRKGPKEKWTKLGWRRCAIFIYLDRFDSPCQSLAFRCKEEREQISINFISSLLIVKLVLITRDSWLFAARCTD